MIRQTLIALTAVAAVAAGIAGTASTAEAKVKVHVGVFFPGYGFGHVGPYWGGGYFYDGGCHYVWKSHKKWNKHHTRFYIVKKKVLVCY